MPDSPPDPLNKLIQSRRGPESDVGLGINMPLSLELVLERRSERRCETGPIPGDVLGVLLAYCGAGPSTSDL